MDSVINWFVNRACNLDNTCKFCFRQKDAPEADTETMLAIADTLADNGVRRVTVCGGEPLLRDDIERVLQRLRERGIFTSLHTNATRLAGRLDRLADIINILSLPIESTDDAVNVAMRGVSYVAVLSDVLPAAYRLGIAPAYKTVVTTKNIDTVQGIYDWIVAHGGFVYWKVYQFRALNDAARHADQFSVDDKAFDDLARAIRIRGDARVKTVSRAQGHQPYVFLHNDGDVFTVHPTEERNICVGNMYAERLTAIVDRIDVLHREAKTFD